MSSFAIQSPSQQVAAYLREELRRGTWRGQMPGTPLLAEQLGVDRKTVTAAVTLLEAEGWLEKQGPGKRRRILPQSDKSERSDLRVAILDYEPIEEAEQWTVSMRHRLSMEGHVAFFTEQSQMELGFDLKRVARLVEKTDADAWIVCSGSRDILTWFSERSTPVFAQFGRRFGLPIAGVGPNHVAAGREVVRRLVELGHRRIVILVRESQRATGPGQSERAMFEEMEKLGLSTGTYNLPSWEDRAEDFFRVLDELFRVTPPTALIVDEPFLFHAARYHLAQRGILAPAHVSLISFGPDPSFSWCKPAVSHIGWDHRPVVRRTIQWVNNVARGTDDRRQTLTKAALVEGGTIGPVA